MHLGIVHDDGPPFKMAPPRIGLIFTIVHTDDLKTINNGLAEGQVSFNHGDCVLLPFKNRINSLRSTFFLKGDEVKIEPVYTAGVKGDVLARVEVVGKICSSDDQSEIDDIKEKYAEWSGLNLCEGNSDNH